MTSVALRPAGPADAEFLCRVYASTRAEELAVTGWDDETTRAFLEQQFRAQDAYYRANYEGASYDVVLVDGEPAGRLYVARWADEIRVMDIALLPDFRRRGAGEQLLRALQTEGEEGGKAVTIHVERENPALGFYRRLGFEQAEDRGVYVFLRWEAARGGLGEDRLILHGVSGGSDRDDEDVEGPELLLREPVGPLRKKRSERAVKNERERRPAPVRQRAGDR
jgi:ribosomal protein S18 acetylase RimI-like enzyme